MRLLARSHFEHVFGPLAGRRVGLVDGIGNVGDHLIYRATRQLLTEFEIDWIVQSPADGDTVDVLLLFGGGNMGGPYRREAAVRREALLRGIPAIVLPQSFMRPEPGPFERLYVRERRSLKHCPQAILAPDLALGYEYEYDANPPAPAYDMGVFLRSDLEGKFKLHDSLGDPARQCSSVDEYLALAALYGHIVTDRLHFAVCGLLNGRRVTLCPNRYHKNRGMWETWLRDLGCRWSRSPDQADV